MSFKKQIKEALAVLEALERLSPKNELGEYCQPFRAWINELRGEIRQAEGWAGVDRVGRTEKREGVSNGEHVPGDVSEGEVG